MHHKIVHRGGAHRCALGREENGRAVAAERRQQGRRAKRGRRAPRARISVESGCVDEQHGRVVEVGENDGQVRAELARISAGGDEVLQALRTLVKSGHTRAQLTALGNYIDRRAIEDAARVEHAEADALRDGVKRESNVLTRLGERNW